MAEFENLEEVTASCEISDLLEADLNLRNLGWANSSELTEGTNDIQEEISESVVEELVEPENDNFLSCMGDNCMEESVVYVFEEPLVDFELSDSQYIIQESETYDVVEQTESMNFEPTEDGRNEDFYEEHVPQENLNEEFEEYSSICEGNMETTIYEEDEESFNYQESLAQTSKIGASDNFSENESTVNICTEDFTKDISFNFNDDSNSVDNNLISELSSANITSDRDLTKPEVGDPVGIIGPLPENIPYPPSPEPGPNPKIEGSNFTTPRNKLISKFSTPPGESSELKSQQDAGSSPALKTLGKDQIKKRLQSFSLLKQGIQALPAKKFNLKQPKVHTKVEAVYDAIGRETKEKIVLKKPPKQGPTPSEKARQVIDEIEQIKKEEAAIYEQNLLYMKHSMLDAHIRKSRSQVRTSNRSISPRRDKKLDKSSVSPHRKDKKLEKDSPTRKDERKDKKPEKERSRKISESERSHKSIEREKCKNPDNVKLEKKKIEKPAEREQIKEEVMPNSWAEIKQKNINFEKIRKIKQKLFNFVEDPTDLSSKNKHETKNKKPQQQQELNTTFKKEDFIKPQLIFEFPSLLRTSIMALSVDGKSKYYPAEYIRFTEKLPIISYCENPKDQRLLFRSRKQVLSEIPEDRADIMKQIMENKDNLVESGRYIEGIWYPPKNFLEESKIDVKNPTSYGLSVLSEMYNDEQEEVVDYEEENVTKEHKKKKEKKKSKKKHKKHKSKSRSPSSEKSKKHKHKKEKKHRHSEEHSETEEKKIEDPELKQKTEDLELKQKSEDPELKQKIEDSPSAKNIVEDGTPDTDEYRSNWESDEEFLSDIIPTNKRRQYKGKIWQMNEKIHNKYHEDRNFENKDKRKDKNPSLCSPEQNRRWREEKGKRPQYEQRHPSFPEERHSSFPEERRPSFPEERRPPFPEERRPPFTEERRPSFPEERHCSFPEERRSFPEERRSFPEEKHSSFPEERRFFPKEGHSFLEERHSSFPEERHNFEIRPNERILNDSFEYRRSEDKNYSGRSSLKSESRRSFDFNFENDLLYDSKHPSINLDLERRRSYDKFEARSIDYRNFDLEPISSPSNLSRPEEKERFRYNSEADYRKNQERRDSVEKYERSRKNERYRKISESSKSEHSNKSRSSLEKDRKLSEFKEEKLRRDSNSRRSVEDRRVAERFDIEEKIPRSEHHYKKTDEKDLKDTIDLTRNQKDLRDTIDLTRNQKDLRDTIDLTRSQKLDSKTKLRRESIEKEPKKYKTEETKETRKSEDKIKQLFDIKKLPEVEKLEEENKREKREKSYSSDREKKRSSKSNKSSTPEETKQKNQWSSEEDLRKSSTRKKSDFKPSKQIEELNFKQQLSDWSSDDEFDQQKPKKYEDNPQKVDKKKKSRWGDSDNQENVVFNKDLLSLKDLDRQRNLTAEIKEKRRKSKDRDDYSRKSSKKSKAERRKSEEKEKYKKVKDKNIKFKDKKSKNRSDYSDGEDSYDEDFQTAKQKLQNRDCLVVQNTENAKKYAAKIKIDYSDFDLSLSESKHTYNKSFDEEHSTPPEGSKNAELSTTPKEKKLNIDLSEIITDQKTVSTKKNEIKSTEKNSKIEVIADSSKIAKSELKSSKIVSKLEISPVIPQKVQNDVSFTPKFGKESAGEVPIAKTRPKFEMSGITPLTPKLIPAKASPVMVTSIPTPIKILSDISPVAPPVLSGSTLPAAPASDPSKLVSEYEEFMKAVSFDEPKEITGVEKLPVNIEKKKIEETAKEDEESDDSLSEESSLEYSSEDDASDSSSDSDSSSASSETRRNKISETVANIKREKLSDSENESEDCKTDKRKRNDSNSDIKMTELNIKMEKDAKKRKITEEIKTFESKTKYDDIIDWSKSCQDDISKNIENELPLSILPENIPLPSETVVQKIALEDIPIPDCSENVQSPAQIDIISISSDSSIPSPIKKPRSFIPIKLLTAESRKQAIEATTLSTDSSGFGKFAPKDLEEKTSVESSSDISSVNEMDDKNSSRKRPSQWNMNISPPKKILLAKNPLAEPDSDEDFTDKLVKQVDKKLESPKKPEETKNKEINIPKPEPSTQDNKKPEKKIDEPKKVEENKDKPSNEKQKSRDKPRKDEHRRSITPIDKRTSRRSSGEKTERRDKKDGLGNKRDRSRDRSTKESVRDRDRRRQSDRRLSDRKQPPRGRSPRSRSSRERELQRLGPRDRSRERLRPREHYKERDRSKDRVKERDSKRSYRRFSRSPSPYRKESIPVHHHLDLDRPEDIDYTATNMDVTQSPVNSPLDGFKMSLADSTISDSELVTQLNTPDESNEPSSYHSHQYYPVEPPPSPKRISLDDRINLVLGIEKEPPKTIDTVCTRGPYTNTTAPNYDSYGYNRSDYDNYQSDYSNYQYQPQYYQNRENTVKVLQVGNVIQVVPTEQPIIPPVPKPVENTTKVLQVGNMLQIVPVTIIENTTPVPASPVDTVVTKMSPEKTVVPKVIDMLLAERKAEKEKRRLERETRRKEKERKRKEKEKRRQLKIKTKTENMIKRALMLETGDDLDISNLEAETFETSDNNLQTSWPPASSLTTISLPKPPGKGILITHGFKKEKDDSVDDVPEIVIKKVVKFADGICPGEGTSPSGGEDLPSPPPPPRKLPKEKRYKKMKNKNKKKIKIKNGVSDKIIHQVKIIRTQQQSAEDDSSEEDNLPPPPPPPGSPPPHLWPPRIKHPPINNIHPSLPTNVFPHASPIYTTPPPQVMYPPAYPPPMPPAGQPVPVVIGHPPPPPLPPRPHHPPVDPRKCHHSRSFGYFN